MAVFNLHQEFANENNFISDLIDKISSVADNEKIEMNLSSFGGDVMLGMPLGETLRKHNGPSKMTVNGMCGSMGAFLTLDFDIVVATPGASFMFHKAFAQSDTKDAGVIKTVNNINADFRRKMEERGIDNDFICQIFDQGKEITLTAKEAHDLGIISNVIKNERKSGSPVETIVATFNNLRSKIMSKKLKFVAIKLLAADKRDLLAVFETPDGVLKEGMTLIPVEGAEMIAGVYTFEGNAITVDATGKITGIEEIVEPVAVKDEDEEIKAAKDEDDEEKVTAEKVGELIDAAIGDKIEAGMKAIQAKLEAALSNVGSDHLIKASFDDKLKKKAVITPKIQAKNAEKALRAKVMEKNKIK